MEFYERGTLKKWHEGEMNTVGFKIKDIQTTKLFKLQILRSPVF